MDERMKIIFTGDFSACGVFYNKIKNDDSIFDVQIMKLFQNADYVHINLENPISKCTFRQKNGIKLSAPVETSSFLKKNNINIANLANNHIMDCGENGLNDTIAHLSENKISYYGIGGNKEYLLLREDDFTVALLSSCHKEGPLWDGTAPAPFNLTIDSIKKLIKQIKEIENPSFFIYNYHGGSEFNLIPEPRRRAFFHKIMNECDIDIIIGHHAHVPQGIEWFNEKPIIYGLGNFCFDLDYHKRVPYTNISYLLEIGLERGRKIFLKQFFYTIDYEKKMIIMNNDTTFINSLNNRIQAFESKKQYIDAWEKECFNQYFKNFEYPFNTTLDPIPKSHEFNNTLYIFNKKIQYLIKQNKMSLFKKGVLFLCKEIQQPNKRPIFFGAILFIIKRGFK